MEELGHRFENVVVNQCCIMPNHMHLILLLAGDHAGSSLPTVIGWLKTMTTNEYIRGVKAGIYPPFDRQIWQRSYHERIIRDSREYARIWRYINENPRKWRQDVYFVDDSVPPSHPTPSM